MNKKVEKALRFQEEYQNRERTRYLKILETYVNILPIALHGKTNTTSSKYLLFGLTASMEGIIKGKNKLGLFTLDLEKLCDLVAHSLIKISHEGGAVEARLLSKLLMGVLVTEMGLLWKAYDEANDVNDPINRGLFLELLLTSIIKLDMPHTTFKIMAEAAGATEKESAMAAAALESLSLFFLILSFANEGINLASNLLQCFNERLKRNFMLIEEHLSQLISANRLDKAEAQSIRLFMSQGLKMLETSDYKMFLKLLSEISAPYGIKIENLKEDIKASRKLFAALGAHFQMKPTQEAFISLIG